MSSCYGRACLRMVTWWHHAVLRREADLQGGIWAKVWAEGEQAEDMHWPGELDDRHKSIALHHRKQALALFPNETALGWDCTHPRALLRLPDYMLLELIAILTDSEAGGRWPRSVGITITVMLPRPEGGFRPIGLLALLPRVWMKARREAADRWEADTHRSFLYAGKGCGADSSGHRAVRRPHYPSETHLRTRRRHNNIIIPEHSPEVGRSVQCARLRRSPDPPDGVGWNMPPPDLLEPGTIPEPM